ncbi:MAG: DUF1700 domain-containing protein [Lachnospiraceae bacterium]|nr:DUF1700 domain-containing protein [Lachnospiraceae bacterium]
MNKQTFLRSLSSKLRRIPKEDYEDAMQYYDSFIDDAGLGPEDDVIPVVGTPEEVARRIIENSLDKQAQKITSEGGVKNMTKGLWLVVAGIVSAPITLPIVFLCLGLFIAVIAVVFSLAIAVFATIFSVIIMGIAIIPAIFWTSGAQIFVMLGYSMIGIGLGTLICMGFYDVCKCFVMFIIRVIRTKVIRRR